MSRYIKLAAVNVVLLTCLTLVLLSHGSVTKYAKMVSHAIEKLPADYTPERKLMTSQGGQDKYLFETLFTKNHYYKRGFFIEFGTTN
jgi:hypothetical protein